MPRSLSIVAGTMVLSGVLGCAQLQQMIGRTKVDNPVMGTPPPRKSLVEAELDQEALAYARAEAEEHGTPIQTADASGAGAGQIVQTGLSKQTFYHNPSAPITDTQIVATVNGRPIFAGDVLEKYASYFQQVEGKAPPAQIQEAKVNLIKKDLPDAIDNELLAFAFEATLTQDQRKQISRGMDAAFTDRLNQLKEKYEVDSVKEVALKLEEGGTTMDTLRSAFEKQQLAGQYIAMQVDIPQIGRPQIFAYYQQHREDYFVPARVRWQQLQIRFSRNGGRSGALQKLQQAVKDLENGRNFGEVAKSYSDGETAAEGGGHDWMEKGTLINRELEESLFQLPVGKISQVFATDSDFQLVRVLGREDGHYTPFDEVQAEIEKELKIKARTEAADRVVAELKTKATIETIFD